jgi:hypothetical protein
MMKEKLDVPQLLRSYAADFHRGFALLIAGIFATYQGSQKLSIEP